jgi:hypothetical protein
MMKKLVLAALLAAMAYVGWRWQHTTPVETSSRKLAFDRAWVDHLPTSERDTFHVFIMSSPGTRFGSIGLFAEETKWHGQVERFRFDTGDGKVHAVFPWSGDREQFTVNARPCDEADMDFCLEISGSKHGVARYYSRKGWERKTVDDAAAIQDLLPGIDGAP